MTAVIIAHDGAAWLPRVLESLLGQTRPVQRVVAVDTGSMDRSGTLLAGRLGQAAVFGMDRATGYAAAVARAVAHRAASTSVPGPAVPPGGESVEWLWLLHDDCEPAPDALERLLVAAGQIPAAAVLGPKIRDWADRGVIVEAGLTIDTAGRRVTGIESREADQGQHDGDRDVLAVSSAGMLIRRDAWELVGGFDTAMTLYREDVDFCWRVHAAGYRVRVVTGAVVYHVQASARRRRPISVGGRPRRLDRRHALITLLGNLPAAPMLAAALRNVTVSVLRALYFLVAKRPAAAVDELGAVTSVLLHPIALRRARRRRAAGRRAAYGRLRADLPAGRSLRQIAEFAASAMSRSAPADTAGSHHATDDPSDADLLPAEAGLLQRAVTSPLVLLFAALVVLACVAERSLLRGGPLGGGALVPALGGASDLWHQYLQGFHPAGMGSAAAAPPYLVIVAALATVLGGKPWLAVEVILLGCVPLAGAAAYLAARRVTRLLPVAVWAGSAYALAPVALGAIAAGRLGTAAVFALLPLIALLAGRIFTEPPKRARRAAWATALAVAIGAAFVPLLWVIAVAAALLTALVIRKGRPALLPSLAIVAVVPPVLLLPWTLQVASHPAALLLEAGLHPTGLAAPALPARSLLLLSPGGPGLPPPWVTAGLLLAAALALLATRRRALVMSGWAVALLGLLIAITVSRISVVPAAGQPAVTAWPAVPLAIVTAGLLLAACAAADVLPRLLAGRSGGRTRLAGPRRAAVTMLALIACSAPAAAAAFWVLHRAAGPVAPVPGEVVPELVIVSNASGLQQRTLVLRASGSHVDYSLLRGPGPSLADPDLPPPPAASRALSAAVAALVAPSGGEAANQGQLLARLDIGFVLMRAPVDAGLAQLLGSVAGLRPVSATAGYDLWRVGNLPARARVVGPGGAVAPIRSGLVSISGAPAPAAGGILELAEPAGGWNATLNGRPLQAVPSPAGRWAQAFRLPAGGGLVKISHDNLGHDLALAAEAAALALVIVLGLPGARSAGQDAGAGAGAPRQAGTGEGRSRAGGPAGGRRGRRRSRGRARPGPARGAPAPDGGRAPEPAADGAAGAARDSAGHMGSAAPVEDRPSAWPSGDQPSAWPAADGPSGWPAPDEQPSGPPEDGRPGRHSGRRPVGRQPRRRPDDAAPGGAPRPEAAPEALAPLPGTGDSAQSSRHPVGKTAGRWPAAPERDPAGDGR